MHFSTWAWSQVWFPFLLCEKKKCKMIGVHKLMWPFFIMLIILYVYYIYNISYLSKTNNLSIILVVDFGLFQFLLKKLLIWCKLWNFKLWCFFSTLWGNAICLCAIPLTETFWTSQTNYCLWSPEISCNYFFSLRDAFSKFGLTMFFGT